MEFGSASRYLYLISQRLQNVRDLLTLFTLDLDQAVFAILGQLDFDNLAREKSSIPRMSSARPK